MTYIHQSNCFKFKRDEKEISPWMEQKQALAWLDGYQACEDDFKRRTEVSETI